MNFDEIRTFAAASRGGARLIGVDLGTKTIGLALSDLGRRSPRPSRRIRRVKFTPDAQRLAALCRQHAVGGLVIGLPLNMDGSGGLAFSRTAPSCATSKPIIDIPHVFFDERLSTAVVTRALIEADASRRGAASSWTSSPPPTSCRAAST